MDIINKNAELMVSQVGHLAFDIDRSLLLMLLGNFMVWSRLLKKRNHTMDSRPKRKHV